MSVNKFIGVGNVGKEPEVKQMPDGKTVTNITMAMSERYKDKTGEYKELTEWVNVVFFGKLAEIAGQWISKGQQIYVEGKLKTDKYEKDGVTKYSTKVVAEKMQLLGKKDADANAQRKPDIKEDFDDALPF